MRLDSNNDYKNHQQIYLKVKAPMDVITLRLEDTLLRRVVYKADAPL